MEVKMSTQDVLNHHLEAFSAGDVDAIMEDYTEQSVLIIPDVTLSAPIAIRAAFTEFFGGLFKPGTYEFTMDRMNVIDKIAYVVWHSFNEGADVLLGTDTFLVRDGKIAIQTFAADIKEK
jgi:ketosteroid isomerase-like protein